MAVASVVLLSSAYGFAIDRCQDERPFLHRLSVLLEHRRAVSVRAGLPPAVNAAILLALSALVFVRIGYVYPSRTPVLRVPDDRCSAWPGALMLVAIVAAAARASRGSLLVVSLFFPVYYTVLSLVLQRRRPPRPAR